MFRDKFKQRFIELDEQFKKLQFHPDALRGTGTKVEAGDWKKWSTSAQNLIKAVFNENSPHYSTFFSEVQKCPGN